MISFRGLEGNALVGCSQKADDRGGNKMKRQTLSIFLGVLVIAAVFVTVAVFNNEATGKDCEEASSITVIDLVRDNRQIDGTAYASVTVYPIENEGRIPSEDKSTAEMVDFLFILLMITVFFGMGLLYIKSKERKFGKVLSACLISMLAMAIFTIALPANVSGATTWYVDDVPGGGPGNPPEDFTSIQDAINAASPGDTIYVYSGTYYENVLVNKSLTLQGEDRDTTIIDGGGSGIVVYITSNSVDMSGFTATGSGGNWGECGISLYGVSGCNIYDNKYISNYFGIWLDYSNYNNITDNILLSNDKRGIMLTTSLNNNISDNEISDSFTAIHVGASHENDILDNNVFSNIPYGILIIWSSTYNNIIGNTSSNNNRGLEIDYTSNNNIVKCNDFSYNVDGILIHSSSNNDIICNDVSYSSRYGIYIVDASYDNRIYHNNIINNANQANDETNNGNQWDNGYPYGGNYWSDFDDPGEGAYDDYQGPGQDVLGADDIVDKGLVAGGGMNPYVIDANSQDNYPYIIANGWLKWFRHYVDDLPDVHFPTHVATALINNDPYTDVVATYLGLNSADIGAVVWYENNDPLSGLLRFHLPVYIDDTIKRPWGVACGDLNGDLTNDVVVAGDWNCLYWYANNGLGGFSGRNVLDTTLYDPKEVFIADINGDTLPDVVATGAGGIAATNMGPIKWYENLGGGSFAPGRLIDYLPYGCGLYVADIDGVGGPDVIATSTGETGILDDGSIVWYANDGYGNFSPRIMIDFGRDGCENVFATDVDMDGKIDIVASMSDDNDYYLGWYLNLGGGLFSPLNIIDTTLEFNGLDIADINQDSRSDIVIATGSADNWVLWYEKPLNPLIDPWTKNIIDGDKNPIPANAWDVSIADIDEDLDMDVVGALYGHTAITWYESPFDMDC